MLKNWDLWGHYHAIVALTMWHEHSGDAPALAAARKAADLVCATYLDTGRRVVDAGDHEMNMSILTAMAMLHRLTGEARYLRMAREVEKDWERAGDYLRAALDGREFFRSPKPRWESLHDLQGLVEMYRIHGRSQVSRCFRASLAEHGAMGSPQHRRIQLWRAGHRQSLRCFRHRDLLHGRVDGTND